jgi:hypothetical protein
LRTDRIQCSGRAWLLLADEEGRKPMREHTEDELEHNALGLKHRDLGLFDQVMNDVTVDHPDTKAYYDGRKGIDYTEQDPDDENDEDEEDAEDDE